MATLRQINANRRNSEKSTGPKTTEGKTASRANALKHGLTGAGVVMPHEEAEAVSHRMEAWRPSYQPITSEEEWHFREMVCQTIRIDRCHDEENALRAQIAFRASVCWDDDRRLDAEDLGDKLAKKPSRTLHQLTRTRQGCEWMIDRLRALDTILEDGGEWTESQRSLALDLLGTPLELRDPDDDFGSIADAPEARAQIRTQIERLESQKAEALDALDDFERKAAEKGLALQVPRTLAKLQRYETACRQRYLAARANLQRLPAPANADSFTPYPPYNPPPAPAFQPFPQTASAPSSLPQAPRPFDLDPLPALDSPLAPNFSSPTQSMNRRQRRAAEKLGRQAR